MPHLLGHWMPCKGKGPRRHREATAERRSWFESNMPGQAWNKVTHHARAQAMHHITLQVHQIMLLDAVQGTAISLQHELPCDFRGRVCRSDPLRNAASPPRSPKLLADRRVDSHLLLQLAVSLVTIANRLRHPRSLHPLGALD